MKTGLAEIIGDLFFTEIGQFRGKNEGKKGEKGLKIQKTSSAIEIHMTMEAREDVQKIQQDLLKELQADTVTVTHLPAVMDDQKPYTTHFSQQVPDLLTITINKGLVE